MHPEATSEVESFEPMSEPVISLALPAWLTVFLADHPGPLPRPLDRMRLLVELARENARRGTGGPFSAGVFERDTGRLVAAGVNVVIPSRCSLAHAEVMAIGAAQRRCATHDLGAPHLPALLLACSAEPCVMCLGAATWSGVRALECGARGDDVEAAGFDEGPKHDGWPGELRRRGVAVTQDLLRADAAAVLREYADAGHHVYNPTR
jgi:tRNA(Arg) A34 adenosine deaminase TadA